MQKVTTLRASVELAGNMKAIVSELVNAIGSAYLQIVHRTSCASVPQDVHSVL